MICIGYALGDDLGDWTKDVKTDYGLRSAQVHVTNKQISDSLEH